MLRPPFNTVLHQASPENGRLPEEIFTSILTYVNINNSQLFPWQYQDRPLWHAVKDCICRNWLTGALRLEYADAYLDGHLSPVHSRPARASGAGYISKIHDLQRVLKVGYGEFVSHLTISIPTVHFLGRPVFADKMALLTQNSGSYISRITIEVRDTGEVCDNGGSYEVRVQTVYPMVNSLILVLAGFAPNAELYRVSSSSPADASVTYKMSKLLVNMLKQHRYIRGAVVFLNDSQGAQRWRHIGSGLAYSCDDYTEWPPLS